jgi:hypothetical protein
MRVHVVTVEPHYQRKRFNNPARKCGASAVEGSVSDTSDAMASCTDFPIVPHWAAPRHSPQLAPGAAVAANGIGAGTFSIAPNFHGYAGVVFMRLCVLDAHRVIAAFHKRVLFDIDGAWAARTSAQERHLNEYCSSVQCFGSYLRTTLLPYHCPFSPTTAELEGRRVMPPCVGLYRRQLEQEVVAAAAAAARRERQLDGAAKSS